MCRFFQGSPGGGGGGGSCGAVQPFSGFAGCFAGWNAAPSRLRRDFGSQKPGSSDLDPQRSFPDSDILVQEEAQRRSLLLQAGSESCSWRFLPRAGFSPSSLKAFPCSALTRFPPAPVSQKKNKKCGFVSRFIVAHLVFSRSRKERPGRQSGCDKTMKPLWFHPDTALNPPVSPRAAPGRALALTVVCLSMRSIFFLKK